jgi:hypothetical protein
MLIRKGRERKKKLVDMLGGKCVRCGYKKCTRALALHFKDASQKQFPLSSEHLWSKPWKKILEEAKKCELMCVRCLAEIQAVEEDRKYAELQRETEAMSYVSANRRRKKRNG